MTALLEVKGLKVHYSTPRGEVRAAEDIDLHIDKGEIVGLAGESGSGKSTLALGVMRLIGKPGRITGGEVRFEGTDILSLSEKDYREQYRWSRMAMVFQGSMNGFTPVFTIGAQIREVLEIHGREGGETTVRKLLETVELDASIASRYPHELSGGQKQRAFIAMSLALNPQLLVADEPTTALDVITQANVMNLLKRLRTEMGISILLITHDLALISEAVDRLYIMYAGRVVEEGPSVSVFSGPKHPYTQGLLASTPTLQSRQIRGIPGFMPDLADPVEMCSFSPRCPFVMDVCRKERPEMRRADGGEEVACWLY
ncbi:MAG: ABC transporter ATP-binding protein [Thaumarchaeota archaeon]|nr:ABC transporter ATP-binding protein [Nitrososphaerota archaeon]